MTIRQSQNKRITALRMTSASLALLMFVLARPLRAQDFSHANGTVPSSHVPSEMPNIIQTDGTLQLVLLGATLTYISSSRDLEFERTYLTEGWWGNDQIDVGDIYGDGRTLAGLTATTWCLGTLLRKPGMKKTARSMMLGLAVDGLLVTSIKVAAGRKRPNGADYRSFPSGHTSGAFTMSTVLSRRYGWRIGIPAYTVASMTALARMEDHKHYMSDVVAGAFLGIIVGRLVTPVSSRSELPIQVFLSPTHAGLQLSF